MAGWLALIYSIVRLLLRIETKSSVIISRNAAARKYLQVELCPSISSRNLSSLSVRACSLFSTEKNLLVSSSVESARSDSSTGELKAANFV
jgi:hypothetical protein